MDEIERLGLQIGDTVLIERAGEVIPHVLKVVKPGKDRKPFRMPKHCPECREQRFITWKESGVPLRECGVPGKEEESILHFAGAACDEH